MWCTGSLECRDVFHTNTVPVHVLQGCPTLTKGRRHLRECWQGLSKVVKGHRDTVLVADVLGEEVDGLGVSEVKHLKLKSGAFVHLILVEL